MTDELFLLAEVWVNEAGPGRVLWHRWVLLVNARYDRVSGDELERRVLRWQAKRVKWQRLPGKRCSAA